MKRRIKYERIYKNRPFRLEMCRRSALDNLRLSMMIAVVMVVGLANYWLLGSAVGGGSGVKEQSPNTTQVSRGERLDPRVADRYETFATVQGTTLNMALPADIGDVIAIGFHEADGGRAVPMDPVGTVEGREAMVTVKQEIQDIGDTPKPTMFIMESRGRETEPTTAVDIALIEGSSVKSPVNGVVDAVQTYQLYGKYEDKHVEIIPDGHPDLRVAIIHIDDVSVTEGQRVDRRKTELGRQRNLSQISAQIHGYLTENANHVHIQVNRAAE